MPKEKVFRARDAALSSLLRFERDGKYLNLEADAVLKKNAADDRERALYTTLLYGTAEHLITLDYLIDQLAARGKNSCPQAVKNILRIALYQLIYLDRIPAHAAVNEAVEQAKKQGGKGTAAFVNAVLQNYLRKKDEILFPPRADGLPGYLSVRYSVSEPICALLAGQYPEDVENILAAFGENNAPTLRVNTYTAALDSLLDKLTAASIACTPTEYSPFGIRLLQNVSVDRLFSIIGNDAYIEDEASQIATCALDAAPGMHVIDVCAAPGGKSVSAAIEMKNEGELLALDLHENKLSLIRSAAEKAGIDIIKTEKHDSREAIPALSGKFDRCICDVPCSGLGVMGKKPDLRYRDIADLSSLLETQRRILDASAAYVRPGGILVYSTCTINRKENEEQLARFLQNHPDFAVCDDHPCGRTLLPHREKTDGFYVAKLIRRT